MYLVSTEANPARQLSKALEFETSTLWFISIVLDSAAFRTTALVSESPKLSATITCAGGSVCLTIESRALDNSADLPCVGTTQVMSFEGVQIALLRLFFTLPTDLHYRVLVAWGPMTLIFVAGSSGYLGTHLVTQLASEKGIELATLEKLSVLEKETIGVEDIAALEVHLEDHFRQRSPDIVINLLGGNYRNSWSNSMPTLESNLLLPISIVQAALRARVRRFISIGTIWESCGHSALTSDAGPYVASKTFLSSFFRGNISKSQIAIVLRLGDLYGPSDTRPKLIPYLADCFQRQKVARINNPLGELSPIHVDDAVSAIIKATQDTLELKSQGFFDYDVNPNFIITVHDLIEKLRELGICPQFQFDAGPPARTPSLSEITSFKFLAGWSPQTPLSKGLARIFGEPAPQTNSHV